MSRNGRQVLIGVLTGVALGACNPSAGGPEKNSAAPDLSRAVALSAACSGCHSNTDGAIVSLSAFSETALRQSLSRYKSEATGTTVMHRLARGYSDEDIALISEYLGQKGDAT